MPNVETVLLSLEERTVITWKEFKEDFLEKMKNRRNYGPHYDERFGDATS